MKQSSIMQLLTLAHTLIRQEMGNYYISYEEFIVVLKYIRENRIVAASLTLRDYTTVDNVEANNAIALLRELGMTVEGDVPRNRISLISAKDICRTLRMIDGEFSNDVHMYSSVFGYTGE